MRGEGGESVSRGVARGGVGWRGVHKRVLVLRVGTVCGYYVLVQLESIDPMIRRQGSDHTGDVVVRRAILLFC